MADRSYPFDDPGQSAFEADWLTMMRHTGEGILNDSTGGSFRATLDSSAGTVTIGPGVGKVGGMVLETDVDASFTPTSTGTQPSSGQTRIDRIVLRLNLTTNSVVRHMITGTPATTGAAQYPVLSRGPTIWDASLWSIHRDVTSTGSTYTLGDQRNWVGTAGGLYIANNALFPEAPLGTQMWRGNTQYRRVLDGNGTPVWWTPETLSKHVGWFWGGLGYHWAIPDGGWNLAPGAEKLVEVKKGHLYSFRSSYTLQMGGYFHNIPFRVSLQINNIPIGEVYGVSSYSVPNASGIQTGPSHQAQCWFAETTGVARISTKFAAAVQHNLVVYNPFHSPYSEFTDLGPGHR